MKWQRFFRAGMGVLAALILLLSPPTAHAQTDEFPFWLDLMPTLANGKITVRLDISSRADWRVDDVTVSIPIPPGTRFLSADILPINRVWVAGGAVNIRLADVYNYGDGNSFALEISDPRQTVFPLEATVSWHGEHPGTETVTFQPFDTTRTPLGWEPALPRLQAVAAATISGDTLTLAVYPTATDKTFRIWDVGISLPVPDGLEFISADAPQPFSAGFDGQTVTFSAIEVPRLVDLPPLTATFSVRTANPIQTKVYVQWTNGARSPVHLGDFKVQYVEPAVEFLPPAHEIYALDVNISQPKTPQRTVFDRAGDVPFAGSDLTAVSFLQFENGTKLQFRTAENSTGKPVEFSLFVDSDCDPATGAPEHGRGAEYRLNFPVGADHATVVPWDVRADDWNWDAGAEQSAERAGTVTTIAFPYNVVSAGKPFCWAANARNTGDRYYPDPPPDWLPEKTTSDISRYQLAPPTFSGAQGKIAVPLFNSAGFYDTYIFGAFTGNDVAQIPYARQPNFSPDGRTLLVNHEQFSAQNRVSYTFWDGRKVSFVFKKFSSAEKIFEYHVGTQTESLASINARDSYPFFNPQGTAFVFTTPGADGSPVLAIRPAGTPPIPGAATVRVLTSTAEPDGVRGNFPVWLSNGQVAFNPCVPGDLRTDCGIFSVGVDILSAPVRLSVFADDIPADASATQLAFMSRRDGNWEVYVMANDGSAVRNLSNAAGNDGLPTFSPDGKWVAFASDRDGRWAVWVVPVTGGEPQKLFTLPDADPWAAGDSAWVLERMTWSP